jgi:drug/metabolite transporter (DMT)-like permease
LSSTFKGVLAAVGGILFLTLNDAVSKYLTQSFPVGQVICLRQAATLLFIMPYVAFVTGFGALRVVSWSGQLTRGALFVGGSFFMVWGLATLPLATVITIMFVSPACIAALSAPLLGERVGLHRWVAIAGGFAGVVIVMRPGGASFEWALLISRRRRARQRLPGHHDAPARAHRNLGCHPVLVCRDRHGGERHDGPDLGAGAGERGRLVHLVGLLNTGAHFLLIEGYRLAEAALVATGALHGPHLGGGAGLRGVGNLPDTWVLVGAAVIVASGVYMIRAESRVRVGSAPGVEGLPRPMKP